MKSAGRVSSDLKNKLMDMRFLYERLLWQVNLLHHAHDSFKPDRALQLGLTTISIKKRREGEVLEAVGLSCPSYLLDSNCHRNRALSTMCTGTHH
jgi:hypothetical protein